MTPDYSPSPSEESPSTCFSKKLLVCFAAICLVIAAIVLSITVTIDNNYSRGGIDLGENNNNTFADLNSTVNNETGPGYISVSTWGGRPPLWRTPITHPIRYVIVSHTAGSQCHSLQQCSSMLITIQSMHVQSGFPDIGYNFLIGSDGNIYEARGWYARNFHRDSTIGISFIGNYVFDELTDIMIDAFNTLLKMGVTLDVLPSTFQIVAHNQTMATLSPGQNVYREIKNHPNFYPGILPRVRED